MSTPSNGTAIGLIGVSMWVLTTVFFAYISTIPPLQLVSMVFFLGYLSMTLAQLYKKEDIVSYWRRPLTDYLFWLGTAGFYSILIFFSFRIVPIFEANILNYLWPILLMIFAALINNERVTIVKIFGGVLGFLGSIAVFMPSAGVGFFEDFHWGHGLSLFSASIWALYSVYTKRFTYPVGFLGPAFLVFSTFCAISHFLFEPTIIPLPYEWFVIIALGVFRVSYAFWDYGMKHGDVILLASTSYFLPLISSLALVVLGFGPVRPGIAIGAALIIIGCLTVNFDQLKLLWLRQRVAK